MLLNYNSNPLSFLLTLCSLVLELYQSSMLGALYRTCEIFFREREEKNGEREKRKKEKEEGENREREREKEKRRK